MQPQDADYHDLWPDALGRRLHAAESDIASRVELRSSGSRGHRHAKAHATLMLQSVESSGDPSMVELAGATNLKQCALGGEARYFFRFSAKRAAFEVDSALVRDRLQVGSVGADCSLANCRATDEKGFIYDHISYKGVMPIFQ